MTKVKFTNTTDNPFITPNNVLIPARGVAEVPGFEKIESHDVMKAWIDGGHLVKGDHTEELIDTPKLNPDGTPVTDSQTAFIAKTDEELGALTNSKLAEYIETTLGGTIKSGANKEDLVKQAQELQAAKVAG